MGRSPLILAALAKDAVPRLNFTQVKRLGSGETGNFDTALLTSTTGEHFVIRIARGAAAEAESSTEIAALRALGAAERMALPFKVTNLVGETKTSDGKRALIFQFMYGNHIDLSLMASGSAIAQSVGEATAAIHLLPLAVVEDSGLPDFSPADIVRQRMTEIDRAAETGKVPSVLLSRWEQALEDVSLFRFQPTVVHGNLNSHTVLELDGLVSSVLDWSSLKISDPAEDFAWILGAGIPELSDSVLASYRVRRPSADANLRQRATLYGELELARWLLHGVLRGNEETIADAVNLLELLAQDVENRVVGRLTASSLATEYFGSFDSASPTLTQGDENPAGKRDSATGFVSGAVAGFAAGTIIDPQSPISEQEPVSFPDTQAFFTKDVTDAKFEAVAANLTTAPIETFPAADSEIEKSKTEVKTPEDIAAEELRTGGAGKTDPEDDLELF